MRTFELLVECFNFDFFSGFWLFFASLLAMKKRSFISVFSLKIFPLNACGKKNLDQLKIKINRKWVIYRNVMCDNIVWFVFSFFFPYFAGHFGLNRWRVVLYTFLRHRPRRAVHDFYVIDRVVLYEITWTISMHSGINVQEMSRLLKSFPFDLYRSIHVFNYKNILRYVYDTKHGILSMFLGLTRVQWRAKTWKAWLARRAERGSACRGSGSTCVLTGGTSMPPPPISHLPLYMTPTLVVLVLVLLSVSKTISAGEEVVFFFFLCFENFLRAQG